LISHRFGASLGICGQLFVRSWVRSAITGDPARRQLVVGNSRDDEDGDQEQAEQYRQRPASHEGSRNRRSDASVFLSERRAQNRRVISVMDLPITGAAPITTAGRARQFRPTAKGETRRAALFLHTVR